MIRLSRERCSRATVVALGQIVSESSKRQKGAQISALVSRAANSTAVYARAAPARRTAAERSSTMKKHVRVSTGIDWQNP